MLSEIRTLNTCLPLGYQPGDTARNPVIYLLDGSAVKDFIHIVGLVQFKTFPWINRVPKSIVVGIDTVNRMRDFTCPKCSEADQKKCRAAGRPEQFMAFLEHELQP